MNSKIILTSNRNFIFLFVLILLTINLSVGVFQANDLLLIVFSLLVLIKNNKITISFKSIFIVLSFVFISFIPFLLYNDYDFFDNSSFIFAFIKLSLFMVSVMVLPPYLYNDLRSLNKALNYGISIIFIFGILQFILYHISSSFFYQIFPNFKIVYGIFRITSIYDEPSLLFYPLMIYFYLSLQKSTHKTVHFLAFFSTVLSFSLTVFFIYVIGVLFTFFRKSYIRKIVLLIILFLFIFISFLYIDIFETHITNLINFQSSSATTRLLGGFEFAFKTPFFGVGLSNVENYYAYYGTSLNLEYFSTVGSINNIFAVVRAVFGLSGFLIFLIFLYTRYFKINKRFFVLFITSFFAWGYFNTSLFFFLLILLELFRIKKKNNRMENSYE